jgi:hypothetical protein
MKKALATLLICLLSITILSGCEEIKPEKVEPTTSQGEQNKGTTPTPTPSDQVFKIGDTFKMDKVQYTVNSIRTGKGGDFIKPDKGNRFIYIMITAENIGTETENMSSLAMFKLVDKDGMSYDLALPEDAKGSMDGELGAGRKMKGEIAYEVPEAIKDFELEVTPSFLGNGMAVVSIPVK